VSTDSETLFGRDDRNVEDATAWQKGHAVNLAPAEGSLGMGRTS
jgi:hypothetical protein